MDDSPLIPRARILLIDDEEAIINLVQYHFTEEGFEVHAARDGHEGLDLFRRCPADVVITDLKMPCTDGLAILEGIKQQDPLASVIIFTAYGSLEAAMAAVRGQASDFILKPLDHLDYLTHAVERALAHRRLLLENLRLSGNLQQLTTKFETQVVETVTSETRRVKMDFVDLVSHQLRTPLYTLRNALDLLQDQLTEPGEAACRLLNIASGNVIRILTLIEQLLQLNRLRSIQTLLRPVDLTTFWVCLQSRLQELASAREHTLVMQAGDPLVALCEESLLEQALVNLVENACRYSSEGTAITVSLQQMDSSARLSVRDQGIGMAHEEQKYLFEPFYRAAAGRLAQPVGTGLGLAIVRAIALSFGGNVGVQTTQGSGSTFWIDLRLHTAGDSRPLVDQAVTG